jgi:antitoxin (DNA-binding transcriptional repressor) of toxin-antitoxin stability system
VTSIHWTRCSNVGQAAEQFFMNILKETQGFLDIFFILGNPLGIGTNHITLPTNPAGEHRERSGMREVIGLGQLRSNACTYLERVAAGETIYVVRSARLLARIVSAGDSRTTPIPADAGRRIELDEL